MPRDKHPERPPRDNSRMIWEPRKVIKSIDIPLNEGITCVLGAAQSCTNTKKCNRKNTCNESLKPFFK